MVEEGYPRWRCCEIELQKEDVPAWKTASLRRENMAQLSYEWITKEMQYDMFCSLFDKEMRLYCGIVDDEDLVNGSNFYKDGVEKLVPNHMESLENFTSGLTTKSILELDLVKSTLEHCQLISEAERKELKENGKVSFPFKEAHQPPPYQPKESKFSRSSTVWGTGYPDHKQKRTIQSPFLKEAKDTGAKTNELIKTSKRKFHAQDEDADNKDTEVEQKKTFCFKSAREQYEIDKKNNKKHRLQEPQGSASAMKKSLGTRPRNGCYGKFVPPSIKDQNGRESASGNTNTCSDAEMEVGVKLKGIEQKIIDLVTNEIMDHGPPVQWDDIAGLEFAKTAIKEIVIWPMLRPDIFTGLRGPPKGILLFGPPGTGKTLIGKCIASQSGATFFSISASSLTSKWVGEGEKMVRALFAVASCQQPAVIFIDEIDSLLSQRCDTEHESSRRIKTEFLVQLDGATTSAEDRILVVGATNRPQEIDEAARRRLSKRLYIPLPEPDARIQIVQSLLKEQSYSISDEEISQIVSETVGFSGADMANLCREAALGPIRSLQSMDISSVSKDDVRPILCEDFKKALIRVKPSVSSKDVVLFEDWNEQFGCCAL